MLDKYKIEYFKKRLEKELAHLVTELKSVGVINPDNPADWEPIPEDTSSTPLADKNEAADMIEGFEENSAILKELEIKYNNVKDALKKIEDGTYGICEKTGKEISLERLEVLPSARTCLDH